MTERTQLSVCFQWVDGFVGYLGWVNGWVGFLGFVGIGVERNFVVNEGLLGFEPKFVGCIGMALAVAADAERFWCG